MEPATTSTASNSTNIIIKTLFKRWFIDFEFPDENGNPYKSSGCRMIAPERMIGTGQPILKNLRYPTI
ncbi:hypothetical protein [Methanosarcina mazei]|jgi:hypothetical protein|uniref:Type I restriction-modification system, specificity subunit S n=1 Tax=Methanosarcina mazei LYC TaxID=1434114 RepID=A0A0E3RML6_METMZ|nr:hypothetical protein [Methanosarcina mazei]AKB67360.1 Type I restriction-modification system, specificity subunit S [Methanosarcina mazei LYC]